MTRIHWSGATPLPARASRWLPRSVIVVVLGVTACGHTGSDAPAVGLEDGSTGNEVDDCTRNPCANGGSCAADAAGISCSCALGFGGERCAESRSLLIPAPDPCTTASDTMFVATDISGDGQVLVGGCAINDVPQRTFRWAFEGGFEELGPPGSTAWRTNRDGSLLVGRVRDERSAASWRSPWTTARVLSAPDSVAFAISADGAVIVGTHAAESGRRGAAFRFSEERGFEALSSMLEGETSAATGVNADGSVIVGNTEVPNGFAPFYWTRQNGMRTIDLPNGTALAVSADGSVVAGIFRPAGETSTHAFRWTSASGVTDLGAYDGYVQGFDLDASGSIIVGAFSGDLEGFIWDAPHGVRPLLSTLKALGAELPELTNGLRSVAISDDGSRIVFAGTSAGTTMSWIAGLPR
jgi:probable HAF family extracellular repeat protein